MKSARSNAARLAVLLVTWGAVTLIVQALLLRETLVLFLTGEISWGLVLAAWLAGVGLGATLGGRLARRVKRADRGLILLMTAFALLAPTGLTLLRLARSWLDIGPGEYVPLSAMAWLSALFVGPFGLLIGIAFPLACVVARAGSESDRIGWVYIFESVGGLIGGLVFTFVLAGRVATLPLAVACSAILGVLGGAYLMGEHRRVAGSVALAVGLGAVLALPTVAARLEAWSHLERWRSFAAGMELRAAADSRYQHLDLGYRDGQFMLYAAGHPAATFPQPTAHRWTGQVVLCQHPDPRRILLLGGGADGMLAELLTHRSVEHVDYVELDPTATAMVRPHLAERDARALADARVRVIHGDPRYVIRAAGRTYDLVWGQFPSPASALAARFYTVGFYEQLADRMAPDGVLAFSTDTSPAELRGESAECTGAIYHTLKRVFGEVIVGWGSSPLVLACLADDVLTVDRDALASRLASRAVPPGYFHPQDFAMSDQLDPDLVAQRRSELEQLDHPTISTDFRPGIYLLWLERWEQQLRDRASRDLRRVDEPHEMHRPGLFSRLADMRLGPAIGVFAVALLAWLAYRTVRRGHARGLVGGLVLGSIGTTGLAAMAGEILILHAVQALCGYVYEQVGAIMALFMLGLACGGVLGRRFLSGRRRRLLVLAAVDAILAGLTLALPYAFRAVDALAASWVTTTTAYGLAVALGMACGAGFVMAAAAHVSAVGRTERTAGPVDAADHLGACLGALLMGVVLIPVWGLWITSQILAGLKIASVMALVAVGRGGPR